MPLWSFLKIVLSGLFVLAVLFVVAVEFSLIQSDGDVNDYAAYQQAAKEAYNSVHAFGAAIINWLDDRSHDFWLAFLTGIIAVFTACLWWSTRRLWLAGEKQILVAKTAADAAKASADASLIALRPWLSCKVEIVGPVTFKPKGDALFKFKFIVKNVGRSPAMDVSFTPHMTLSGPQNKFAILMLKKMADLHRDLPVNVTAILVPGGQSLGDTKPGLVLFPEETHTYYYRISLNRSEIEKSCEDIKPSTNFWPVVYGIVVYSYPLATIRATTGFVLDIEKRDGVFTLDKMVPKKDILLRDDGPLSGGFAT